MEYVKVYLGRAQRRILQTLLNVLLDKYGDVEGKKINYVVKVVNGKVINPSWLAIEDK
jgi:hypothetical protein